MFVFKTLKGLIKVEQSRLYERYNIWFLYRGPRGTWH